MHIVCMNTNKMPLNEFFSYGITFGTLHIHVIPASAKAQINELGGYTKFIEYVENQLDDALIKIEQILMTNNRIHTVFAVSPSMKIKKIQKIFTDRGFDVAITTEPYFCKMFNVDSVWHASISKDKFLNIITGA